jgi:hypothetical protein
MEDCQRLFLEEIERFVVEQIKCIGSNPALVVETIQQLQSRAQHRTEELENERRRLERN